MKTIFKEELMMFKTTKMLILDDDSKVDVYMKLAANHKLYCQYKIRVYGKERQHELFVTGRPSDYREFLKEIDPSKKKGIQK
jgi:hypothetical protein